MLNEQLADRRAELKAAIAELETTLDPLQRDLAAKREEYALVSRLLGLRTDGGANPAARSVSRGPSSPRIGPTLRLSQSARIDDHPRQDDDGEPVLDAYHGIWADICEVHGWSTGTDSAHRIVIRHDPGVHARVAHHCKYDGETYP